MKKLVILFVVGLLLGFSACALGQATLTWNGLGSPAEIGGYYSGNGGVGYGLVYPRDNWAVEIIFTDLQGIPGYANGSTLTTFCIEWDESFDLDSTVVYNATVNDGAINGGVGGNPDPICDQTAWLYEEYVGGNSFGITDLNERAAYVQEAIWIYEQEQTSPPAWALTVDIMNMADAAVAGGYVNDRVKVLNITYPDGSPAQDVLVIVPVPGAVLLGGIGVGFVGWMRRRKSL